MRAPAIRSLLLLGLVLGLSIPPASAERTEWSQSAGRRTKTIYDDRNNLLYQAHWDSQTGEQVGEVLDLRVPPPPAVSESKPREASPSAARKGKLILEANSLVRVRIDTELHSGEGRTRRGASFRYQLLDSLEAGGRVLLADGAKGQGIVTNVRSRGGFGRSGKMTLDFGSVTLPGGQEVRLVTNKASEEAGEMAATAAGTAAGGMLILGPIGIVGGVFMKGRDIHIPAGTVTYLAVEQDVVVEN